MSACPSPPRRIFPVFLILITLFLNYSITSPTASANSIYNRSPWPVAYQGLEVVKENTDFQDAAHPCNRTHGRSFGLTHADGFKLSGLSVYVYIPNSQDGKFNQSLFRLSFGSVTKAPSTYSALIGGDGGGRTFEVYFPLSININGGVTYTGILECLTSDPADPFRIPESSRIGDGLITGYYNSNTSQTLDYYMSGRKILFTTFSERNSPHFPALASNSPIVNSQLSISSPKFHPVIFIHGLGGDPTNFESDAENRNYVKLLTDLGYPRDYIHLYSYGYKYDPIKRVNYYNYQGDVREIAQGMEVVVNTLSELNKSQGGDGRVDIVAHSLGNLVTRQYLFTHKDNHKIRRYIAVGAPFKGAWFMSADKNLRAIPVVGKNIEKIVAEAVLNLYGKDASNRLSKDSVASVQATPGSDFLSDINKATISNLELYEVYGDVSTTIRQKVFSKTFETKLSLGDGLILPDSATFSDWTNFSPRKFAYTGNMLVNVKFDRQQGALAAEIKMDNPGTAKSLHSELLTRDDSKGKIVCLLQKETANDCYN